MTTQKPEALRLAEILEGDYCPDWFYEQGVDEVAAELRRQHARIAELEAQLEAIGAGGVSGPLMGCAPIAASAGSEPVAWTTEREHAIRQGHEIVASDGYFEVRPQIDSNDRRKVFRAGFERGWDAARAAQEGKSHGLKT